MANSEVERPTETDRAAFVAAWIEIRTLTARSGIAFDAGDGPGYAATYTVDGEMWLDGERLCLGSVELAGLAAKPRGFVHVTADPIIEVHGDMAMQRCTLLLYRISRDKSAVAPFSVGRYEDDLVRTATGWLFARRQGTLYTGASNTSTS
jgi:hypothetical protein